MNTPQLQSALDSFRRRQRRAFLWLHLTTAVSLAIALLLLIVLADAALALPSTARIAVDALLIVSAAALLFRSIRRLVHWPSDPRRLARALEQRLQITDSRFINAVELSALAAGPGIAASAISPALLHQAVADGEAAAASIEPAAAIDPQPLRQRLILMAVSLLVAGLVVLLAPRMFTTVIPRFLSPTADLPPFSLVTFDITIEPARVRFGHPARIVANLAGPIDVTTARIIFLPDQPPSSSPSPPASAAAPLTMLRAEPTRFIHTIDRAQASARFYIDTPWGRSATQRLDVLPVPDLQSARLTYTYPAYTHWPPASAPLTDAGLSALRGSVATLDLRSTLPLKHVRLTLAPLPSNPATNNSADPTPPTAPPNTDAATRQFIIDPHTTDPHAAAVTIPIDAPGQFRITLVGSDGTPADRDILGPIRAQPDHPPSVQILEPDLRVIAPVGYKLPLSAAATDDVAVTSLHLHLRRNEDPATVTPLTLHQPRPTSARASHTLDLPSDRFVPGDTVRAFIVAHDNHTPPQSAESATIEVRIVTQAEYEDLARQQYGIEQITREVKALARAADQIDQQRERLIEDLKALRDKIAAQNGQPTADDTQRLAELQQKLADLAQQSDDLARVMEERAAQQPLYTFEPPVQKQLADEARKHAQNSSETRRIPPLAPNNLDDAINDLERQRQTGSEARPQRELTQQELERFRLADQLMGLAQQIIDIAEAQRDLEQRLAPSDAAATEPMTQQQQARLHRLGLEQRTLQEELEQTLTDLDRAADEAADALPKMSASAREIAQAIRSMDVTHDQYQAAEHALGDRHGAAHLDADKAADKLESMIGQCKACKGAGGDDLDGALGLSRPDLSQAMDQMDQARPGRGRGNGSASGASGSGGAAAGGSGAPAPGAARPSLAGPHASSMTGPSAASRIMQLRQGGKGTYNRAGAPGSNTGPDGQTQVMQTQQQRTRDSAAPGPDAVPLRYRDLTQQYFKKLAEDSR
jgi:hypothetical protein